MREGCEVAHSTHTLLRNLGLRESSPKCQEEPGCVRKSVTFPKPMKTGVRAFTIRALAGTALLAVGLTILSNVATVQTFPKQLLVIKGQFGNKEPSGTSISKLQIGKAWPMRNMLCNNELPRPLGPKDNFIH